MELSVIRGDITTAPVEAIVTAANQQLAGGGGVDAAVHRAAGPALLTACRALAPCPPGRAVITPGFDLPAPIAWVVHAVGPRYGIDEPADALLASAYAESLARCDEVGARSVAFPAISAGAYGYPRDAACAISVAALAGVDTAVQRCLLVAFDDAIGRLWQRALDAS